MASQFETHFQEMRDQIGLWEKKLHSLSEDVITTRRNSQNRTIKQILGHMVDSATNNTHRVIHLQYQESPCHYPDYANLGNNDRWIAIQNYQEESWEELIQVWKYTNLHYLHVVRQIDPEKLRMEWISALDQRITLEAMVMDYPRHFSLHLQEMEELINQ